MMTEKKMICKICCGEFNTSRALASHIQQKHHLKTKEYTIEQIYDGFQPMCEYCGEETRYLNYSFKSFCKEHSKMAMKKGGEKGGKAEAWNKGKTSKEDGRILRQCGKNNHFYGKSHTLSSRSKNAISTKIKEDEWQDRILKYSNLYSCSSSYTEFKSIQGTKLSLICNTCNSRIEKTLFSLEKCISCPVCHPRNKGSNGQREIEEFLTSNDIIISSNDRTIINPKEIDIYIQDKMVGIEYNGLYWHSIENKPDKMYHLNKSEMCSKLGISLFHIFSDEWSNKRPIIESMLKYRLGRIGTRYFARKCNIIKLTSIERRDFFNNNHISGDVRSTVAFGLVIEDKIVSCISLRKPAKKKYKIDGSIEIARFANLLDCTVVGGFSKLLKEAKTWSIDNSYTSIMTYSDNRFGNNNINVYSKNKFNKIGTTVLDYWYTNGRERFHRYIFRANDGMTEKDISSASNVHRIYGCGSDIYKLIL